MLLGLVGLLLIGFAGYRFDHRNDAEEARSALRKMTSEIALPGSTGPPITEVREPDCPAGQPRRAIRTELSALTPAALLTQLSERLDALGWSTEPQDGRLPVVGVGADTSIQIHRYRERWEIEVHITPDPGGSTTRMVVSSGISGLTGCY